MICKYCKTEQSEDTKKCLFCGADLKQKRPLKRHTVNQEEAYQSQPILETYHTYDLLLMLKHLRKERTTIYKTMQVVRKAPKEAKKQIQNYKETNESGQKFYRDITARQSVIEQILIDRMGYYPRRIDKKLLDSLQYKIQNIKH